MKVKALSRSAGTISGDSRCGAPIASTFHGASIASTLWLKRRLRTGWRTWPFSTHHSPSRVSPVRTMVRGSTSRTYQKREMTRPRAMPLIIASIDAGGCVPSTM